MKIIESIYIEPEKWRQIGNHFTHCDGIRIYTGAGLFFYNTDPEGSFGIIWKFGFARAYTWWCENQPV